MKKLIALVLSFLVFNVCLSQTNPEIKQIPVAEGNSTVTSTPQGDVYTVVDVLAEYPGGLQEMMKFIQTNLKYPKIARDAGLTGKCWLKFVVLANGEIGNVQVLKGIAGCPPCDEEAVRVVKSMPKWKPSTVDGKPVSVFFNLPINFTLTKR